MAWGLEVIKPNYTKQKIFNKTLQICQHLYNDLQSYLNQQK